MELTSINIKFIDNIEQKYETAGDYWQDGDTWQVRISNTPDWRHKVLVMMHELNEMILTTHHNVPWEQIDLFDTEGEGKNHPDPGTLPSAPYHNEHWIATKFEKQLAKLLDVDWKEYEEQLDLLEYK